MTRLAQPTRYLTRKRVAFLDMFKRYSVISTTDAYALTQAGTETQKRATRRFLLTMFQAGYVLRTPLWNELEIADQPHWHYAYRLSKRGAEIVHGKTTIEQTSASVKHDDAVTAFSVLLETRYPGSVYLLGGDLNRTINPDKAFGLQRSADGPWYYFFLEHEEHRQSLSRRDPKGIVERLKGYSAYRQTDACSHDWVSFDDFRVLVSVPSTGRSDRELANNLLRRLRTTLPVTFIWIATNADWRGDIMGPIWRTPRDYDTRAYSFHDI